MSASFRRAAIVVVAALASLALLAPAAGAANGRSKPVNVAPLYRLAVTGATKSGATFRGTYGIQRFVARGDAVLSVGTLTGRLAGHEVKRYGVRMPATLTTPTGASASQTQCSVLRLLLGPVNLNLLGLKVTLGGGTAGKLPILLDITAVQGGGLLGDLLCGVTNLLDQNGLLSQLTSDAQQLSAVLNSLLSLLGGLQATQP